MSKTLKILLFINFLEILFGTIQLHYIKKYLDIFGKCEETITLDNLIVVHCIIDLITPFISSLCYFVLKCKRIDVYDSQILIENLMNMQILQICYAFLSIAFYIISSCGQWWNENAYAVWVCLTIHFVISCVIVLAFILMFLNSIVCRLNNKSNNKYLNLYEHRLRDNHSTFEKKSEIDII